MGHGKNRAISIQQRLKSEAPHPKFSCPCTACAAYWSANLEYYPRLKDDKYEIPPQKVV